MWQQIEKITVANGGTATFTLAHNAPLERLTIWANSNGRTMANVSFQPQINGNSFGAPTPLVGVVAADLIYTSGGAATENALIPYVHPRLRKLQTSDPFVISVLITNAGASPIQVTMMALGVEHNG